MRAAFLVPVLAFFAAKSVGVVSQAVEEGIAPEAEPPAGCDRTIDGNFTLGIATSVGRKMLRRDMTLNLRETAEEAAAIQVECTLTDGILVDSFGRIGSVVANYQFQFDGPPPQAGAIYTGGFSVCKNSSLALGGSTVWYRCMSGEFGNLYDRSIGDQCSEVRIVALVKEEPKPDTSSVHPMVSSVSTTSASATTTESASASGDVLGDKTGGTWSVETPSMTRSVENGTYTVSVVSSVTLSAQPTESGDASGGQASGSASAGFAAPTRVPRKETFGAVVGLLGAALMF